MKKVILTTAILLVLVVAIPVFADITGQVEITDAYENRQGVYMTYDLNRAGYWCGMAVKDPGDYTFKICNNACPYADGENECACNHLGNYCPGGGPYCRQVKVLCIFGTTSDSDIADVYEQ